MLSGAENKGLYCSLSAPVFPFPQSLIYQSNKISVIRKLTKDRGALPLNFSNENLNAIIKQTNLSIRGN